MDDQRWLTDREREAWVRFASVFELLPAALDAQLRRDSSLTHFDYMVLAMLSEAPGHTLRASTLATKTSATLARLSNVVRRLESRGLVARSPHPGDGRATNIALTADGWEKLVAAAPGHVNAVLANVIDPLTVEQVDQLTGIMDAILDRLDPDGRSLASGEAAPREKPGR